MSTKIYSAYRIKKDRDILALLKKCKEIAIEVIANDESYLRLVHSMSIAKALKDLSDNPKNSMAQYTIDEHKKGNVDDFWIESMLEKNQTSTSKINISAYLSCSIFYDADYWYIKFFTNERNQYTIIDKIVETLELEDYHYQNQTDTPEGVSDEDFEARGVKWDELLESSNGNYRDGFTYTIFDAYEFRILLTRFSYTGKPLYEHLAYKFDKIFIKTEEDDK